MLAKNWCAKVAPLLLVAIFVDCHGDRTVDKRAAQQRAALAAAVGCYGFSANGPIKDVDAAWVMHFSSVRLDSTLIDRPGHHFRRAHFANVPDTLGLYVQVWQVDSLSDTVRVLLGDSFGGMMFSTIDSSHGLHGYASYYGGSNAGLQEKIPIKGERKTCASSFKS